MPYLSLGMCKEYQKEQKPNKILFNRAETLTLSRA